MRGDIERFLEGRSVSVKADSKRELFIKFVKRNKGFSAGAAAALLVLLLSSVFLLQSWLATRRAYAAYQKEQEDKRAQARQSVPAFVEAARLAVQRRKFEDALAQVNVAVDYDPDHAGARLMKGQLLASRKDFAAARPELEHYLKLRPEDTQAAKLVRLCARFSPEDPAALAELADILLGQDLPRLAEGLLDAPGKLLEVHRRKIELAWPGLGPRLTMDKGELWLNLDNCPQILNLAPLQGMPLWWLNIQGLKVRDLTPLKGMPLTTLNLAGCSQITDLSPLEGMQLTTLNLTGCDQIKDLTLLKKMPLASLHLNSCVQIKDLSLLKGMKLTELGLGSCGHIKDFSALKDMPLTSLVLTYNPIEDLSPLRGLPLTRLDLSYSGAIHDLTPLKGMPLSSLILRNNGQVEDLTPLKGMPLTSLCLNHCSQVADLTPLRACR